MVLKRFLTFTICCLFFLAPNLAEKVQEQHVKQDLRTINDGPYVFVDSDQILTITIKKGKAKLKKRKIRGQLFKVKIPQLRRKAVIPIAPPSVEPDQFEDVDNIFILSDIHGQYKIMQKLLIGHGIVNKKMKWSWGQGHLVILGDVFDRGPQVTEVLWTIHQLEREARKKGGRVHLLFGNHEVMVLRGDYQDIHPKYTMVTKHILNLSLGRLYYSDSILGRWLRTKHSIIKINEILFVHAGISPEMLRLKLTLSQVNHLIRNNLDSPGSTIIKNQILYFLFKDDGPLWYRGYFLSRNGSQESYLNETSVQHILDYFKVSQIVVGHTTLKRILTLFEGRIIGVDSGILHGDRGEGLLWQKGNFYRATMTGERLPLHQP